MQAAFTAALEAGATTFLFQPPNTALATEWQSIAKFNAVSCQDSGQGNASEMVRCFMYSFLTSLL